MKKQIFSLLIAILTFGVPQIGAAHNSQCEFLFEKLDIDHLVDKFRSQPIRPMEFKFENAKGQTTTYEVGIKLGESSSEVWLTTDHKHVVKVYRPRLGRRFRMEMHEILITQYLAESGMSLPKIVDYTSNIFVPNGKAMVVVKEYRKGLGYDERRNLGIAKNDALKEQIKKYEEVLKGFRPWLEQHKYGPVYFQAFGTSSDFESGDIYRESNWILGPEGWILVDP